MNQDEKIKELTARFKTLDLSNPEVWAKSEVVEGIPHYASSVFKNCVARNYSPYSAVAQQQDEQFTNISPAQGSKETPSLTLLERG